MSFVFVERGKLVEHDFIGSFAKQSASLMKRTTDWLVFLLVEEIDMGAECAGISVGARSSLFCHCFAFSLVVCARTDHRTCLEAPHLIACLDQTTWLSKTIDESSCHVDQAIFRE